jgi:hypothetical protein
LSRKICTTQLGQISIVKIEGGLIDTSLTG